MLYSEKRRQHHPSCLSQCRAPQMPCLVKGKAIISHVCPNAEHPDAMFSQSQNHIYIVVCNHVCPNAEHPDATPKGNRRNLAASFNTFSTGPRNCVGQSLALTEARTILAVLLARFRFELPAGVSRERFIETEEVTWVTLQTRQGLLLKLTPLPHQMPEE